MLRYLDLRFRLILLMRFSTNRSSAKVVGGQRSKTAVVAHATAPTMAQLSVRLITAGMLTVGLAWYVK